VSLQVEKVAVSASERSKSKTTQREEVIDDTAVPQKTDASDSSSSGDKSTEDRSSNHSSSEGSLHLATETRSRQGKDPHPPGFRTLINRIDKFSGHQGDDDFELWLLDFKEVTTSCGWDDNQRSKWFSWFLSGPAKATWQRTLKEKDKRSWKKIVEIYRGQYGIHLDPRIAYQRCQELQYSQFGSAQGLLDAMRDYQRMAPEKLSDATMESILWNEVPVELQQELKEIPDGSVQELLKKLLRAESVVAERKRRRQEMTEKPSGGRHYVPNKRGGDISKKSEEGKGPNSKDSSQRKSSTGKSTLLGEASMQHIKCYKCKAKGHMARDCPEVSQKPGANVIESEPIQEVSEENTDPWLRTVSAGSGIEVDEVPTRGPTCKANITVDNVKTRALLDHGAQVSIVRRELLPKVRETQGWTKEQYQTRNLKLDRQPIGANGTELGVVALVKLEVSVEGTDKTLQVPCYVLNSNKPLWKGELWNCGLVLGTNCLEKFGFSITHPNGQMVRPAVKEVTASQNTNTTVTAPNTLVYTPVPSSTEGCVSSPAITEVCASATPSTSVCASTSDNVRTSPTPSTYVCASVTPSTGVDVPTSPSTDTSRIVVLDKHMRIGPFQTKVVPVNVVGAPVSNLQTIGMITPSEVVANLQCDFTDEVWNSGTSGMLAITNWSGESLAIEQGTTMGNIEEVDLVSQDDPVWGDIDPSPVDVARLDKLTEDEVSRRKVELESQLVIGGACSEEECSKFKQLLLCKHLSFALKDTELGETSLVEHVIDTGEAKPARIPPRCLPYVLRKELEDELIKLESTGCIEPSTSPYASGLVLVRKKDGTLRVCVDYRQVNKDTVPDRYPMPRVDELVDAIGRRKGKYFTTLDLMKGYHQVKMEEQSKPKTAFTCHLGLYQYRRMPFGLTNAPATFQRLMNKLFSGKEWEPVFVYLDDILVVSASFEDHLRDVGLVLDRLKEAGLHLKPSKCSFARKEVVYLGFTVSSKGVTPNQEKVKAIVDFPQPTDCKSVRRFLGMLNFYRRHIQNLAAVARPLTALTHKDPASGGIVQFKWSPDCEKAFKDLKEKLVSAPVLCPPDLSKQFFVWTDASLLGFGAVIEQLDEEGQRHPIAYASRQTNNAEQKYAPTQLEVAAVEHFEVYLLGQPFTVYTDHQPLVSAFIIHLKSQTRGLLARWYLRLARFLPNMKIEYKPGATNVVADALSRAPTQSDSDITSVTVVTVEGNDVLQVSEPDLTLQQVQTEQRKDPELAGIIDFLTDKTLPSDPHDANVVVGLAKKGYYVVDGILYYEGAEVCDHRCVVVPSHLRQKLLDEHHDLPFAGHFAAKKMAQRIKQFYYWRGLRSDVHKKCSSCVTCASVRGQGNRGKPPLVSIPVGSPFDMIGMDFIELDVSKSGNRYALVFQDYLSKWPEVYALSNRRAETVAKCLQDLVWRHGVPNKIVHDRAAEFLSDVLQETAVLLGMRQLPTSGGHPQTDGLVERFNRTLKQMLAKIVNKGGHDWDELLGPVLLAYRATPHASSGMSPFYLMYGRDPQLPSQLEFQVPVARYPIMETEYGQELVRELKQARSVAKQNIGKKQKEQKRYYDQRSKEVELRVGDLVMLKTEPRFKLDRSFKGPFVVKSLSSTNAMIQLKDESTAELLNVSRQRLSRCEPAMALPPHGWSTVPS